MEGPAAPTTVTVVDVEATAPRALVTVRKYEVVWLGVMVIGFSEIAEAVI